MSGASKEYPQVQIRYIPSNQSLRHTHGTTKSIAEERWEPVSGWPYEASSLGKIRRTGRGMGATVGKILKGGTAGKPGMQYPTIVLSRKLENGVNHKTFLLHAIIAKTFLGPTPDGMEIDHKDGNRFNCRLDNLEFKTPSQNILGSVERGHRGINRWNARFTENDIVEIRRMKHAGTATKAIAEMYQVSNAAIQHIVARRLWKHVA